ncbi:hypothetical protein ANN_21067 [Periplaneta americana]|uniref:Uncharacterized protein n=1 Tax=Periplaneta americana TaxID=6978 RepID=A0ABQ8SEC3_PERAM|nr:hypothetical protein ANN_21067 [Periplaneta americana]
MSPQEEIKRIKIWRSCWPCNVITNSSVTKYYRLLLPCRKSEVRKNSFMLESYSDEAVCMQTSIMKAKIVPVTVTFRICTFILIFVVNFSVNARTQLLSVRRKIYPRTTVHTVLKPEYKSSRIARTYTSPQWYYYYLKSKVYRNKSRTIIQLKQNIRNEISAIEPVLLGVRDVATCSAGSTLHRPEVRFTSEISDRYGNDDDDDDDDVVDEKFNSD